MKQRRDEEIPGPCRPTLFTAAGPAGDGSAGECGGARKWGSPDALVSVHEMLSVGFRRSCEPEEGTKEGRTQATPPSSGPRSPEGLLPTVPPQHREASSLTSCTR